MYWTWPWHPLSAPRQDSVITQRLHRVKVENILVWTAAPGACWLLHSQGGFRDIAFVSVKHFPSLVSCASLMYSSARRLFFSLCPLQKGEHISPLLPTSLLCPEWAPGAGGGIWCLQGNMSALPSLSWMQCEISDLLKGSMEGRVAHPPLFPHLLQAWKWSSHI